MSERRGGSPTTIGLMVAGYRNMPTAVEYHGTWFRSTLERDFARHLDLDGSAWTYEPRIYGPKGRRYLPDFVVDAPSRRTFFEIKPTLALARAADSNETAYHGTTGNRYADARG
jgi:hypothetical protein